MEKELVSTSKRAGRTAVSVGIAAVVAETTGNPVWLALAPFLAALGKFLRCVFKLNFIPF